MQKTREMVPLAELNDAAHNPPNRITPKNIRELQESMDAGESPRTIMNAVRKGKPIKMKLQIEE